MLFLQLVESRRWRGNYFSAVDKNNYIVDVLYLQKAVGPQRLRATSSSNRKGASCKEPEWLCNKDKFHNCITTLR